MWYTASTDQRPQKCPIFPVWVVWSTPQPQPKIMVWALFSGHWGSSLICYTFTDRWKQNEWGNKSQGKTYGTDFCKDHSLMVSVNPCCTATNSHVRLCPFPLPTLASYRIIESLRLEKTSKIIKSNHQANTIMPAKPCPEAPHLHVFWTPPGMGTPPLPWAAYSNVWPLFQ